MYASQYSDLIEWTRIIQSHCPNCTSDQCLKAASSLLTKTEQPITRRKIVDIFQMQSKRFTDTIDPDAILRLMDDQPEFEGWSDFGGFVAQTDGTSLTIKGGSFMSDEYDVGVCVRINL